MFGWIKRLGRKKAVQQHAYWDQETRLVQNPQVLRASRISQLQCDIKQAKRRKKKHSHLAAELARLEQADRPSNHMIQEPGQ